MATDFKTDGMCPPISTFELVAEPGHLAGEASEMVERTIAGQSAYAIMPGDRGRRTARFWRAVQADASGGFRDSAEQAVAGFAAGVATWVAKAAWAATTDLPAALRAYLGAGPRPAAEVLAALAADGVSHDRVSRAVMRMGVNRWKTGLAGGWKRALPEGGEESSGTTGVEEREGPGKPEERKDWNALRSSRPMLKCPGLRERA